MSAVGVAEVRGAWCFFSGPGTISKLDDQIKQQNEFSPGMHKTSKLTILRPNSFYLHCHSCVLHSQTASNWSLWALAIFLLAFAATNSCAVHSKRMDLPYTARLSRVTRRLKLARTSLSSRRVPYASLPQHQTIKIISFLTTSKEIGWCWQIQ